MGNETDFLLKKTQAVSENVPSPIPNKQALWFDWKYKKFSKVDQCINLGDAIIVNKWAKALWINHSFQKVFKGRSTEYLLQ